MNIVHSLWTKPHIFGNAPAHMRTMVATNIACYTASVLYAQRQDLPINLYADGMGQELLSFLPYNERYVLSVPDNVPMDFWAAGKFFALKMMPLHDIHIDGDVFLVGTKKTRFADIFAKNSSMIIQSVEDQGEKLEKWYAGARTVVNKYMPFFWPGTSAEDSPAYNCGLVGFNDDRLRQDYIKCYMHGLRHLSKSYVIKEIRATERCTMDLVCEQQWLYQLVKNEYPDAVVNNLLGEGDEVYKNADKIGYLHLLGKYKSHYMKDVLNMIQVMDKDIYKKCIAKINSIN